MTLARTTPLKIMPVLLICLLAVSLPAADAAFVIAEKRNETNGQIYREKRWLRGEDVILIESWLTRASDHVELNHMQVIVREGKTLFSLAKKKEWSALASNLGGYQLTFELSESGTIQRVSVIGDQAVVLEQYARRPDGFYEPSPIVLDKQKDEAARSRLP